MRRVASSGCRYDFEKRGAFGVFRSNGSIPIEYIMTTFDINEIVQLSFARDVNTELNFDYLIQRDIDEERALAEISQYIASSPEKIQKDVIFLPPLLAAVVSVDDKNNLDDYYPNCKFTRNVDDFGDIYEREWNRVFKIENYPKDDGRNINFSTCDGENNISVDIESAKIKLNITPNGVKGARLVVIDGQHRLFALSYLRENMRNLVEDLIVPVCIVYPSGSFSTNSNIDAQPKVPQVLRSLFVDVNSTVERVSGHFLTLLSEQTLGSIICREFCKTVLLEKGVEGLGLVEWNTKKHKESLEISREHTITSIGVINSAFDDVFKTKNGVKLLINILNVFKRGVDFDFGRDEYDEPLPIPEYFPWRDYQSVHKEFLSGLVNEIITPLLINVFFETDFFKSYHNKIKSYFTIREQELKAERSYEASYFNEVKNYYLYNKPFSEGARVSFGNVRLDIQDIINSTIPSFSRKSIFQKAVIEAWTIICAKFIINKVSLDNVPSILVFCINNSFDLKLDIFNERHLYLQDTIYSGSRIKVTRTSRRQIARLILSNCVNTNKLDFLGNLEKEILLSLAESEIGGYISQMGSDKRKVFEASYRTNFSLSMFDRERLIHAEESKSKNIKKTVSDAGSFTSEFDEIISELISDDLKNSYNDLSNTIAFNNFVLSNDDAQEDDY
ncbi:hypothetical protein DBR09_12615 [Aeromonas sp. HMWF016]|nr:hypothetical protein DBR09_12615 [Aeromonas sp. HMWF016]